MGKSRPELWLRSRPPVQAAALFLTIVLVLVCGSHEILTQVVQPWLADCMFASEIRAERLLLLQQEQQGDVQLLFNGSVEQSAGLVDDWQVGGTKPLFDMHAEALRVREETELGRLTTHELSLVLAHVAGLGEPLVACADALSSDELADLGASSKPHAEPRPLVNVFTASAECALSLVRRLDQSEGVLVFLRFWQLKPADQHRVLAEYHERARVLPISGESDGIVLFSVGSDPHVTTSLGSASSGNFPVFEYKQRLKQQSAAKRLGADAVTLALLSCIFALIQFLYTHYFEDTLVSYVSRGGSSSHRANLLP
ncbi:hypothetical protein FVE85_2330 [Porphyridium purpureum]|uniref:Uncharacterized protein n=1 Tax=Porphyridium purpureum TaxID=35688 RepID=A0A5J4YYH6_PORPP|nr:hypothetical protein FVE85_2330 [Porphyridium purpureum]|eukprot:POR9465..scf209_3